MKSPDVWAAYCASPARLHLPRWRTQEEVTGRCCPCSHHIFKSGRNVWQNPHFFKELSNLKIKVFWLMQIYIFGVCAKWVDFTDKKEILKQSLWNTCNFKFYCLLKINSKLHTSPIAQEKRPTINRWDPRKLNGFCPAKDTQRGRNLCQSLIWHRIKVNNILRNYKY